MSKFINTKIYNILISIHRKLFVCFHRKNIFVWIHLHTFRSHIHIKVWEDIYIYMNTTVRAMISNAILSEKMTKFNLRRIKYIL